jgi:cystathionine beta-lyase
MTDKDDSAETRLVHAGNHPEANHGVINPPVYHASTILFPTVEQFEQAQKDRTVGVTYGRSGTPTTFALEEAVAELEGGIRALALPSGLAAISATLLSLLNAGDHLLMVDSVYGPVRSLCDKTLARLGIETTYYDPLIGAGIADLIRPTTRIVYLESPGSLTFEVQDVPAIAAAARANGVLTVVDNTWATPLFFRPLQHGADIVIHAATKYIVGHSDVMLGIVVVQDPALYRTIKLSGHGMGYSAAPDDCYLALRGLRTLAVRLHRHQENGLALARWLQARPEVDRVLHPALPDDPGHALWRRDFAGASGLFSVLLKPCSSAAVAAMVDGLRLFGLGASWGGYESLILPVKPELWRTDRPWQARGPLLRIHAGLEAVDDLIADLEAGFARLATAG